MENSVPVEKLDKSICYCPWLKLTINVDILLNVFLAIAVDNLANAESLTEINERRNAKRKMAKEQRLQKLQTPVQSLRYGNIGIGSVTLQWICSNG